MLFELCLWLCHSTFFNNMKRNAIKLMHSATTRRTLTTVTDNTNKLLPSAPPSLIRSSTSTSVEETKSDFGSPLATSATAAPHSCIEEEDDYVIMLPSESDASIGFATENLTSGNAQLQQQQPNHATTGYIATSSARNTAYDTMYLCLFQIVIKRTFHLSRWFKMSFYKHLSTSSLLRLFELVKCFIAFWFSAKV